MNTYLNNIKLVILVFLISCTFYSCYDKSKPVPKSPVKELVAQANPSSLEAEREFYHAWLADCVNDLAYKLSESATKDSLLDQAVNRITSATLDSNIIAAYGTETLVWGPSLLVSEQQSSGYYTSQNLMYCLKSKDATGKVKYSVGIAGTNMISPFDWFNEDLDVGSQVTWTPGGKISKSSNVGFGYLKNLTSPTTGKTLEAFLKNEIVTNPGSTISVAGHSLGGAQTQVYSSYLKSSFKGLNTKVEAWVYAGPTAGNALFAKTLTTDLDAYHAFNNSLDVVAHAWQADRLNKLCSIYNGLNVCSKYMIGNNPALNGVVNYMKLITKNGGYTEPGNPASFTGVPYSMTSSDCSKMEWGLYALYSTSSDPYDALNAITKNCTQTKAHITKEQFYTFFFFMSELGVQHTSGYFNYFFKNRSSNFKTAIKKYVPGNSSTSGMLDNGDEGKIILDKFLASIPTSSSPANTNCNCTP